MQNVDKKSVDSTVDKVVVYSFSGSVLFPTEQGAYWANAIGGTIASRPIGNPYLLFDLKYIWDVAGVVSEFAESIRIRLNTAMAVTENPDFKFPVFEAPSEVPVSENTTSVEASSDVGDVTEEVEDFDEGDIDDEGDFVGRLLEIDDEGDVTDKVEDELSRALRSNHEISW